MWWRGPTFPRENAPAKPDEHFMVRSQVLGIWICVANHDCANVRDKHGLPIKTEEQLEAG